jgi:hypothetical protein
VEDLDPSRDFVAGHYLAGPLLDLRRRRELPSLMTITAVTSSSSVGHGSPNTSAGSISGCSSTSYTKKTDSPIYRKKWPSTRRFVGIDIPRA